MKEVRKLIGNIPISTVSIFAEKAESAKDIVFIHMSWGDAWIFALYMKFFAQAGYNCHALDLRGHGNSGGTVEGATMQDYVDDVRDVVRGLGIQNPIVIGHSMGGLIALMYSAQYGSSATVSLDGSPGLEAQKTNEEKTYPKSYTPTDSGMPTNPMKAMVALPDIYPWRLMKMKKKLTVESGIARSERKRGISVPKEKLGQPLLFIGAEKGTSLPFGIGIEKARAQAKYYNAPVVEIKNASHPGLLIGKHWRESAQAILDWLRDNNL
ncbi:MAG: alpha/beta hydrolase [Patescibacteria group bacterium]|nr:MAG: alpha/beta hydrolase [Patescibacteria group bacterium]